MIDIAIQETIKRNTLTEQIVEIISDRIIRGQYAPNSPLIETELSKEFGVSRSPLREALRVLSEQGLVEISPGRGASVTPLNMELAWEYYDIRALLESECTRLTVATITDDQIADLRDRLAELRLAADAGDYPLLQDLNTAFHYKLYSFCPNHTLYELVQYMFRRTTRYSRLLRSTDAARAAGIISRKVALIAKIEARDAEGAAETMRNLITSGRDDALAAIAAGDPFNYWSKATGDSDERSSLRAEKR